jgi:hypothetical protein
VEIAPSEPIPAESKLKNIALFFAAPFIGLVYAVMLPFVGIGLLALTAVRALKNKSTQA